MSRDYVLVTFIGGPWDLMRRAMSLNEISRGAWKVLEPPPGMTQDFLTIAPTDQLQPARVVTYYFRQVTQETWIATVDGR